MPASDRSRSTYRAEALRRSWDRQQEAYLPDREVRFEVIVDLLQQGLPHPRRSPTGRARSPSTALAWRNRGARILDLGCGTGSLSERILERLPNVRSWAIDHDPVLLRLGRDGLGSWKGRLTWVDADLREPGWDLALPAGPFDAAVSTTALHWLTPTQVGRLYGDLARRLRPGGLFLNGDGIPIGAEQPRIRRLVQAVRATRVTRARRADALDWNEWWVAAGRVSALTDEFKERKRRYPRAHGREPVTSLEQHRAALRRAGFREAGIVWQDMTNRVLLGLR